MAGKPATSNGENYDRLARILGCLVCADGICSLVLLGEPMNADERQALREKHAEQYGLCVFCSVPDPDLLGHTLAALYPCDTIKVLDATEPAITDIRASATFDVLPTNECKHVQSRMLKVFRGYSNITISVDASDISYRFIPNEYCPKCNEMLV